MNPVVFEMLTDYERSMLTFDHRGALMRLSHGVRTRRPASCALARSFLVLGPTRP
jgi:hypothetical protein